MSTADPTNQADRLVRQSATLQELTEAGMRLVRALTGEVEAAAPRPVFGADPALAFSRLSRSVRLTLALETRLAGPPAGPAPARMGLPGSMADTTHDLAQGRRLNGLILKDEACARVRGMIEAEAEANAAEGREGFDTERLLAELDERLDERDDLEEIDQAPLVETVRRLCADLGVRFDADVWADLACLDAFDFPDNHVEADFTDGPSKGSPSRWRMGEGRVGAPRQNSPQDISSAPAEPTVETHSHHPLPTLPHRGGGPLNTDLADWALDPNPRIDAPP